MNKLRQKKNDSHFKLKEGIAFEVYYAIEVHMHKIYNYVYMLLPLSYNHYIKSVIAVIISPYIAN